MENIQVKLKESFKNSISILDYTARRNTVVHSGQVRPSINVFMKGVRCFPNKSSNIIQFRISTHNFK